MDGINDKIQERSIKLLGERTIRFFRDKTIAILGLGGVGGTALEALARSGFMNFFLVDCDRVEESNLNRQILFSHEDVGLRKVDIAMSFLGSLTDGITCTCNHERVTAENLTRLLDKVKIDFIVDAIDDVQGKLAIIKYASARNIPCVVSGGMANRLNPTKIEIVPLSKAHNDPLSKKLRKEVRDSGIDVESVMVVHSTEEPIPSENGKPNAMIMVPSAAGLFICYYVVDYFTKCLPPQKEEKIHD